MSEPTLVCHYCGHHDPTATLGGRCPADGSVLVPEPEHLRAPQDTLLGRVIGSKYAVVGLIGEGAMGAVYRALQEPVGREVAVKVIRGVSAADEGARARFVREARVVAQLSNPATVTLFDYGFEADGVLYMVLELVRGRRLTDVLEAEGPFPATRIASIACQVLNALAEAHRLGLVHRDVKPDNIMLARGPWGEEQAKVLDFGIAKVRGGEDKDRSFQTAAGIVLGTPSYMAPEQATEAGVDGRADLYAVGVVMYQALTGRLPFTAPTVFEVLLAHRDDPVPPMPAELGVPPALEAIVRKALAKRPEERYCDAAEMAQALLAAVPMTSSIAAIAAASGATSRSIGGEGRPEAGPAETAPGPPVAAAAPVPHTAQPIPLVTVAAPEAEPASRVDAGPVLPKVPGPVAPSRSGRVLPVVIVAALLLLAGVGGGAWFLVRGQRAQAGGGASPGPDAPALTGGAAGEEAAGNAQREPEGQGPEGAAAAPTAEAEPAIGEAAVQAGQPAVTPEVLVERVLFADEFQRADYLAVGGGWREYVLRMKKGLPQLKKENGDWVIRRRALSIWTQAWTGPVEDLAVTDEAFPIDGTRVEFELSGKIAGNRPEAGLMAFWVADPESLASGLGAAGDRLGVAWSFPGNRSKLHVLAGGEVVEQPGRTLPGFNPAGAVRHALTIRGGTLTYEVGDEAPITVQLGTAPAPDERRHFVFGIRAWEQSWHMVDVRSFRIVALEAAPPAQRPLVGAGQGGAARP